MATTYPFLRQLSRAAVLAVAALGLTHPGAARAATIDKMLGFSGGGNGRATNAMFEAVFRRTATGTMRVSAQGLRSFWWFTGDRLVRDRPKPWVLDGNVRLAHDNGQTPIINLIATPENGDVTSVNWYWIGRRFAERFKPGSQWNQDRGHGPDWGCRTYMIFNEINAEWYHKKDDTSAAELAASREKVLENYREMNQLFAYGVRSAQPGAKVYLGPLALGGGTGKYSAREHVKKASDLFLRTDNQRIDGFGLQTYPTDEQNASDFAKKADVDKMFRDIRAHANITGVQPELYATELNIQARGAKTPSGGWRNTLTWSQEQKAAKRFLTLIWSHLGVRQGGSSDANKPAMKFVLPFSPFSIGRGQYVSLTKKANWSSGQSWVPNRRGRVLQLVAKLGKGLTITEIKDSRSMVIATGNGKKLWAFNNVAGLSNSNGNAGQQQLTGIPASATELRVFYFDSIGFDPANAQEGKLAPAATIDLTTKASFLNSRKYLVTNLRKGETVMFLAD